MSYAIRRRADGLAVAGVLVALPLFGSAAIAAPGDQDVTFDGGGPGVLLCGSTPAIQNITAEQYETVAGLFGESLPPGPTLYWERLIP